MKKKLLSIIICVSMVLAGCSYKIHCHEGTEAQKQLDANGIEWVKIE